MTPALWRDGHPPAGPWGQVCEMGHWTAAVLPAGVTVRKARTRTLSPVLCHQGRERVLGVLESPGAWPSVPSFIKPGDY